MLQLKWVNRPRISQVLRIPCFVIFERQFTNLTESTLSGNHMIFSKKVFISQIAERLCCTSFVWVMFTPFNSHKNIVCVVFTNLTSTKKSELWSNFEHHTNTVTASGHILLHGLHLSHDLRNYTIDWGENVSQDPVLVRASPFQWESYSRACPNRTSSPKFALTLLLLFFCVRLLLRPAGSFTRRCDHRLLRNARTRPLSSRQLGSRRAITICCQLLHEYM